MFRHHLEPYMSHKILLIEYNCAKGESCQEGIRKSHRAILVLLAS